VDGCFWHGHNCRNTTPKDNSDYWDAKRERNRIRDEIINKRFTNRKWNVIRIWECELKEINRELLIKKIGALIK
ncbi:MAG TPA: very short patch repair endonuclease, partial [Spirochaetota bacterium]|nr:very short patch repair endonuclease [Spirochaetota bacterium]